MPVKVKATPILPGLSPVRGKAIVARFDGACMSSDGGLLALGEVESRLNLARRLAAYIRDPRDPSRVIRKRRGASTLTGVNGGSATRLCGGCV